VIVESLRAVHAIAALLAIAAAPQRVALALGASAGVTVTNAGSQAVIVDAASAGYALDLRGRPRFGRPARPWFRVRPSTVRLRPGGQVTLQVTALRNSRARPGDHASALVLASRPLLERTVKVRVRVGVVVVVRTPGRLVRRLSLGSLTPVQGHDRLLRLVVVNGGNVDQWVGGREVTVRCCTDGARSLCCTRNRAGCWPTPTAPSICACPGHGSVGSGRP
jgi:translation initiation factor IF-1